MIKLYSKINCGLAPLTDSGSTNQQRTNNATTSERTAALSTQYVGIGCGVGWLNHKLYLFC